MDHDGDSYGGDFLPGQCLGWIFVLVEESCFMKTIDRHHLRMEEVTVWILMVILFAITVAAGYLFWLKVGP